MSLAGILTLVDSSLNLGTAIVGRLNLKDKKRYIDDVTKLKIEYKAEDDKPDGERNDARLEDLEDLLLIKTEAMNAAIQAGILADST